jgi:hypothetical protein
MKKRHLAIALGGFLMIIFGLFQMGFTAVLNQTDKEISVSVVNDSRRDELTGLFGTIFIGFPQIEGSYEVVCRASGASEQLGYTTKRGFNRIIVGKDDIAC